MKICTEVNAPFLVQLFVTIVMCWFHLIFNIKKHESFTKLDQTLRDMLITDLTRLHYCLEYEYEPFKSHNKANDKPPLNVKEVKKNVKRLQTDKRTPAPIVIISPKKKGPGRPRKARPALVI